MVLCVFLSAVVDFRLSVTFSLKYFSRLGNDGLYCVTKGINRFGKLSC